MATYGSAEWAQQHYGSNPYKPPTPAQATSQPSYYQQYIEQMKAKQAEAQRAAEERSRYETLARANEAQRREMEQRQARAQLGSMSGTQNSGMEYRDRDSFWYRMTQMPAKESGIGADIGAWFRQNQNNNAGMVGRNASGMWSNYSGINQFTGLPYQNYGNLPLEARYQYGLPTTRQDYINLMEQFRQHTYPLVMADKQVVKPPRPPFKPGTWKDSRKVEEIPPDVLGNTPPAPDFGGYPDDVGQYPDFPDWGGGGWGGYGGGGWNYPKYNTSQDASKWYQTMVQWNIGNK